MLPWYTTKNVMWLSFHAVEQKSQFDGRECEAAGHDETPPPSAESPDSSWESDKLVYKRL